MRIDTIHLVISQMASSCDMKVAVYPACVIGSYYFRLTRLDRSHGEISPDIDGTVSIMLAMPQTFVRHIRNILIIRMVRREGIEPPTNSV